MTAPARSVCQTCKRPQKVRKDGAMFKHRWFLWVCPGSGQKPRGGAR